MEKSPPRFLGKKLAVVVAHPDDESYLAAGTILKNNQLGGKSFVVCATAGEKGKSHLQKKVTDSELKKIRRDELEKVSKFLKTGLVILNFPDTKLKQNKDKLFRKISPIIKENQPDFIISFGKDGISGHLDHISIGQVSRKISQKLKIPFVACAAPPHFRKPQKVLKRRRKFGRYIKNLEHDLPNTEVKIDSKLKRKVLLFHKSQLNLKNPFANTPKTTVNQIFGKEYFIQ